MHRRRVAVTRVGCARTVRKGRGCVYSELICVYSELIYLGLARRSIPCIRLGLDLQFLASGLV
jgi:hypothetical protein